MSIDEKVQKGDKIVRDIGRYADMIQRISDASIPLAQGFLEGANQELARLEPLRDKLKERVTHPTGAWHHHNVDLMCRMAQAMKRGAELSIAANTANVGLLDKEDAALREVRVVGTEPQFVRERARLETALAEFLWIQEANGIDTVLRAFGEDGVGPIEAQSPEEEATREKWAAELKAAAAADAGLKQLVTGLAAELDEMGVYLAWAVSNEPRLASLEGPALKAALADPDWAKFFGHLNTLTTLGERVRGHAALAKHFPEAVATPA